MVWFCFDFVHAGNILLLPLIGAGDVNILLKDIKTSVSTKISLKNMPEVSDADECGLNA